MYIRRTALGLSLALTLVGGAGCGNSVTNAPLATPESPAPSPDTLVRVHWQGKERLGVAASAYYFMRLWALPESKKLQQQTLEKLCATPWRFLRGETQVTNVERLVLLPLLNDVVWNESCLEIRQPTNQPAEFAFAIRLNSEHAGLWETNLAVAMQSLTGVWPVKFQDGRRGWSLKQNATTGPLELVYFRGWTLLGTKRANGSLLDNFISRIKQGQPALAATNPKDWIDADVDLSRLDKALFHPVHSPVLLPRLSLAVTGDGGHVITRATLTFPKPLQLDLEPWTVPTNRIIGPLMGFTAIRGVEPWLASCGWWKSWGLGAPPNQYFFWDPDGIPKQIIACAPNPDADSQVRTLSGLLLERGNHWLAAYAGGRFEALPESKGVMWRGLSALSPFVRSVDQGRMVLGALTPSGGVGTNAQNYLYERPSFSQMLHQMSSQTNLLYYDWELTGARIDACMYLSQVLRVTLRHPELSYASVSANWLRVIKSRLGNSYTTVNRTNPNQLVFYRKSALGLTGAELQVLADWLESPQFPVGLHTLLVSSNSRAASPSPK